jgi:hypothetical protein
MRMILGAIVTAAIAVRDGDIKSPCPISKAVIVGLKKLAGRPVLDSCQWDIKAARWH